MKKGTEAWTDYDSSGRWCIRAKKQRGKFDLDELQDIAMQFDQDYYAVIIKAIDDDMMQYFDDVDHPGDYVTMYRATDFFRSDQDQ